jgi:hypothetical protein
MAVKDAAASYESKVFNLRIRVLVTMNVSILKIVAAPGERV